MRPDPAAVIARVTHLVVATFNRDKLAEIRALLLRPDLELLALADIPGAAAPEETGATLLDNARIKARAARALSGLTVLAEDTGLEVDALGGAPGAFAARYAGPGARDQDHVRKLLLALEGVPSERRGARFRTVCVALLPDGGEHVTEGVLEGRIATAPRGTRGFGYQPVFEVVGTGLTLAEMTIERKNAISHRAHAVRAMAERLVPRTP